ncbi:MAG: GH116 family glycosyl-hydrolase [Chryseolinea sp.]
MRSFIALSLIFSAVFVHAQKWPVLKTYEGQYTNKVALPVGGIGTGTISIGGNGQWKDVEIMNKPGKGFYGSDNPKQAPCFLIYTEGSDGKKLSKALMGPLALSDYEGAEGSFAPNHGIPRFKTSTFETAYPFATVNLEDPAMPVSAKLHVFNPYIPGDADKSGLPIAIIRYEITNKTNEALKIAVAGTMDNFVGMDGTDVMISDFNKNVYPIGAKSNRNTFKTTGSLAGILMSSDSVDKKSDTWGTIALTTKTFDSKNKITYRTELNPKGWNANMNDMWDDFSDDGMFKDSKFDHKVDRPRACLSVSTTLAAGETRQLEFFLTWDFPNRRDWFFKSDEILGNYYSNNFSDAWDVAEKVLPQIPELEKKTVDFVNLIVQSDYPEAIKEAALFNSSTLRTQTTFRTSDGNFFGWEGIFNSTGSCHGNCTHVWNYEQATPFLFGSLARKMRDIEYDYGLNDKTGFMSFRVSLPLKKGQDWNIAAADGQMGTIMKVYREWQLSGDNEFLKNKWPGVKKALSFAWIAGGWDADRDGVMEGCQHNTMDIEYYGPNPEIEFWYLGALKAASAMAKFMKDRDFEMTCTRLFNSGSRWTDENLFNGEYYIQKIQPIADRSKIAAGLISGMGSESAADPDFQIGEGCLVDQLVGQYMAHICGLGYLTKRENVKKALESIWKYNYVESFGDHFNNMRSYGLGNDSGLLLAAYPNPERRPKIPFSYYNEVWSGLEYTAATGMIYEGLEEEGEKVIVNVRNRHDGLKRNPYDEAECGHHYARAMASWATLVAYSEFNYSGVEQKFSITGKPGKYFWSNGYSWGNATVADGKVKIDVHYGTLPLRMVEVRNGQQKKLKKPMMVKEGESFTM